MKLFKLLLLLIVGIQSTAFARRGGDMPFPIGKVIELPVNPGKENYWKVPKVNRFLKIELLKVATPDGNLMVQLMGYKQLSVIAEGIGKIDDDKMLRAILTYKKQNRYVAVTVGAFCLDEFPLEEAKSFSIDSCLQPRYMVGFEQITGGEKREMRTYLIRKAKKIKPET